MNRSTRRGVPTETVTDDLSALRQTLEKLVLKVQTLETDIVEMKSKEKILIGELIRQKSVIKKLGGEQLVIKRDLGQTQHQANMSYQYAMADEDLDKWMQENKEMMGAETVISNSEMQKKLESRNKQRTRTGV